MKHVSKPDRSGALPLAGFGAALVLLLGSTIAVGAGARVFPIVETWKAWMSDFQLPEAYGQRAEARQAIVNHAPVSYAAPAWLVNAMPAYSSGNSRMAWFSLDRTGDPVSLELASTRSTRSTSDFSASSHPKTSTVYIAPARVILPPIPVVPTANQTWDGGTTGNGTAWFTVTNWVGDAAFPGSSTGVTTNTDIATIPSTGTNPTIGINFATPTGNTLYLGAIDFTAANNRGIGDSSNTSGTLQLNGATVNAVANVIIHNSGSATLTLQPTQANAGVMSVALGNTTDNIINIDGSGGVTISAVVKDGPGNHLTLGGGGTGSLILSAPNTYTGGTTINSTTLLANNTTGSATGTGAVTVNNTGTLGGTGFINAGANNVTVNSGGRITGATNGTVGTLTLTANTLVIAGTDLVDINGLTADRITLTGNLDLSSATDTINFNQINAPTAASYTLLSYTGTITGTFDNVLNLPSGYDLQYNNGEIDLVAVPEPTTWIGAALALGAIGWMSRRSVAKKLKA
jgi:autotransporter-associated beta strand protein